MVDAVGAASGPSYLRVVVKHHPLVESAMTMSHPAPSWRPTGGRRPTAPVGQPTFFKVLWSVWGSRSGSSTIRSMVVSSYDQEPSPVVMVAS